MIDIKPYVIKLFSSGYAFALDPITACLAQPKITDRIKRTTQYNNIGMPFSAEDILFISENNNTFSGMQSRHAYILLINA